MQLLMLLITSVFASNEKEITEKSEPNILENPILVKIEEDEYIKANNSHYIGATYNEQTKTWRAYRHNKHENKRVYNGTYKDEETAAHASDTLARKLIANGEKGHKLNFPDDDIEVNPEKSSHFIGVSYSKRDTTWRAYRHSKNKNKIFHNGSYKDEETAAHASDTLARKLIANDEKDHKLNFPDDHTVVNLESERENYFGVIYNKQKETWIAWRWSKSEKKTVYNGASYKDEETAAHASDTLARKLIANGEKGHILNFPDDDTEHPEKISKHIGVNYNKQKTKMSAQRWSKNENKTVHNGTYKDEETAAHASDTLAKKLIANGEKGHTLNFPDNDTDSEVYPKNQTNKRKRPADFEDYQKRGKYFDK